MLAGARRMIEEGILEDPVPDFCLALHLWNDESVGWVGLTTGPVLAGSDMFEFVMKGKGGHGANPDQTIDPIYASAQLITALQSIVSRNVNPRESAVLSIGQLTAGDTHNVIPEQATMRGTIRSFEPKVRQLVIDRFKSISANIATAFDCEFELKINGVAPPTVNDPHVTQTALRITKELFPDCRIEEGTMNMGSEDMALILEAVPGCYILIGSQDSERSLDAAHHNPQFNFSEAALPIAVAIISATALKLLDEEK
jgi:amidohydrolase